MFENSGHAGIFQNSWRGAAAEAAEADAIEKQLKQTQSGSSRRSGRHWGADADAIGERAAAEADAIRKQLKRTQSRAAAEAGTQAASSS